MGRIGLTVYMPTPEEISQRVRESIHNFTRNDLSREQHYIRGGVAAMIMFVCVGGAAATREPVPWLTAAFLIEAEAFRQVFHSSAAYRREFDTSMSRFLETLDSQDVRTENLYQAAEDAVEGSVQPINLLNKWTKSLVDA